ncbi:MAG: DNA polymerase III subunit beta [Erysipelotrichaceae bacterium]|nr:DNA polymerase III subunit beta [Erysipelotrichaceae bacterium]
MKIKIKKDLLLENLNKVSKAISTKNLVPALAGIKFDLNSDGLTLTASDNDITIQSFIKNDDNMTIEEEGSIIIQGRYILDIVRKLPDNMINLEVFDELKVIISTENSEYNLNGINKSEYPNINLEENKNPILINSQVFKELVNQTAFAASNDESRPPLTGLNFKIVGDILECNCTDSYRLARKVLKLAKSIENDYNIVIPSKNIVEFSRLLTDDDKDIELHIFNNKILFKYDNILFQSRLINGNFPNTANLLPKESFLKLTVNVDNLYDVIDRVSILTSDKEKNVVTLETSGNTLTMKSSSAEIGRVEENMQIKKDKEEDIKISFSARYVMEALKVLDEKECEISFVGEVNPIIFKGLGNDELIQLVLPIRTY